MHDQNGVSSPEVGKQVTRWGWWLVSGLGLMGGAVILWRGYADTSPREDWESPSLGTMKYIPAGTFTMGSPEDEVWRSSDETQHRVAFAKAFLLMEHEVTQGEWASVMGNNPSNFTSCGANCPVEQVSWDKVQVFIQKVGARDGVQYRLPSEAEWEYAARGGQSYIYAGSNELGGIGWYAENSGDMTHPVCEKQRNGYGLCDMSGNVWEWVQDWYGDYPGDGTDYVNNKAGSDRVARGGSWILDPEYARVAVRLNNTPSLCVHTLGFRLARTIP